MFNLKKKTGTGDGYSYSLRLAGTFLGWLSEPKSKVITVSSNSGIKFGHLYNTLLAMTSMLVSFFNRWWVSSRDPKSKVITVTSNYKETNGEFAYLIGGPNIAAGKRRWEMCQTTTKNVDSFHCVIPACIKKKGCSTIIPKWFLLYFWLNGYITLPSNSHQ